MFSLLPINRFRGKKPETGCPSKVLFVTHLLPKGHFSPRRKSHCFCKLLILLGIIGRDERIRTSDPLNPIQVSYQAALRPDPLFFKDLRQFRYKLPKRISTASRAGLEPDFSTPSGSFKSCDTLLSGLQPQSIL